MERRYIITSHYLEDDNIVSQEYGKRINVMEDEGKAKTFIENMVGCMYDEGGKIEIEVKLF